MIVGTIKIWGEIQGWKNFSAVSTLKKRQCNFKKDKNQVGNCPFQMKCFRAKIK